MTLQSLRAVVLVSLSLILPPLPAAAEPTADSTLEYIYIDANTGGSSGGHVALKLNDTIYHFQYFPDHLFRIVRDTWRHFRYIYNDLENRTLFIAKVKVTPTVFRRIKDRLSQLYLIQNAHLNILAGLQTDIHLLESMLYAKPSLTLRGAGLFAQNQPSDEHGRRLQARIKQRYGRDFLPAKIHLLDQKLATFTINLLDLSDVNVSLEQPPSLSRTLSQQYLELWLQREALVTLAQARPLQQNAVMSPPQQHVAEHEHTLSKQERRRLWDYSASLEANILSLVGSPRVDSGFPLLLATARYLLIQRSLEINDLLVLTPFSEHALTIPADTVVQKHELVQQLAARAYADFSTTRQHVFALSRIGEADYNRLENSAARYYEIQMGATMRRPIRVERGRLIPSLARSALALAMERPTKLKAKLTLAKHNYAVYKRQLQEQYGFDLITHNCATELTRHINASFANENERITALGGRLQHGEALTFIPFRWFGVVQQRLRVSEVKILPSYRKRRLAQLSQQEHPATIYLREFNTLTSTIYNDDDSSDAFLLFTDDVFWPRPLYAVANLAYGLATTGVGLLTLPVEGNKRIKAGFRGTLFSLPELFFFNIRKGSFEFVEGTPADETPEEADLQESAFQRQVAP